MRTIEVEHEWSKERKTLSVERIDNENQITVRWPLQGLYHIDLRTNTMKAYSALARSKSPICLWRAVDIDAVRRDVKQYLTHNITEAFNRHVVTMPFQKG